jgi:choline/ethanolamine kinase
MVLLGPLAEQEALVRRSCAALPADEWRSVPPDALDVTVLSGAMTNSMFLCRVPGGPAAIVRIFGELGALVDRALEMAVFDQLSRSKIGPGMLGVIYDDGTVGALEMAEGGGKRSPVGRIEEFLDGWTTLGAQHYQCESLRHLAAVAVKLAKCHDIEMACASREARILRDLRMQSALVVKGACEEERWRSLMASPIDISTASSALIAELEAIHLEADDLRFCHNDLQHGNVMMHEASQQYTFIDFEYAGYNPVHYDMANIWCEVPANYEEGISPAGFLQVSILNLARRIAVQKSVSPALHSIRNVSDACPYGVQ